MEYRLERYTKYSSHGFCKTKKNQLFMISLIQPMQFIFLIKYLDLTTWNISLRLFYYSFNWASSSLFKSCCLILLMQLHLSYTTWTLYLTAADCLYSSYLDPNTHPSWASIVLYEHKHHKKMFRGLGTFSDCFHLCSISTLVIFFFFKRSRIHTCWLFTPIESTTWILFLKHRMI